MAWLTGSVAHKLIILLSIAILGVSGSPNTKCDRGNYGEKRYGVARQFYSCYRNRMDGGVSDLIILMDSSGSMGWGGWYATNKFVKSLLSEIRIGFNATRIAVVAFDYYIRTPINYIWYPKLENHKCKFIRQYENIRYTAGGTNIRDAFKKADEIFYVQGRQDKPEHKHRPNANRVVIMLTDGYGWYYSHAEQLAQVNRLKTQEKAEIYTVGLTSKSDINFLKKAASSHDNFFTTSFSNLKTLATNIRGGKNILLLFRLQYELQ